MFLSVQSSIVIVGPVISISQSYSVLHAAYLAGAAALWRCLPTLVFALYRAVVVVLHYLAQGVQHSKPCESCCLLKIPWEEICQKDAARAIFVFARVCAREVYNFPRWGVCVAVWMSNTKIKPHTHADEKYTHTYETRTTTKVASVCEGVGLSYAEDGLKDYIFIIFLSLFFGWLHEEKKMLKFDVTEHLNQNQPNGSVGNGARPSIDRRTFKSCASLIFFSLRVILPAP